MLVSSRPDQAEPIKRDRFTCADVTNEGIKSISAPKFDAYKLFQKIRKQIEPFIFNEF